MSISSRSVAVVGLLLGTISCWGSAVVAADWAASDGPFDRPLASRKRHRFQRPALCGAAFPALGQPVIIENRPGADGVIGVSAFLATDDDHTLLYAISAVFTVHPITNAKLPYDPLRDLVPISRLRTLSWQ